MKDRKWRYLCGCGLVGLAVFLFNTHGWAYNWTTNPANGHRYTKTNYKSNWVACETEAVSIGDSLSNY